MSAELVLLHHNEPMTTSLAIAEGVGMEHKSVLQLIRNHVDSLANFGGVAFEMRPFDTKGGCQWRDVYFLNEPQSTLLITFMRNSEIVVRFKIALVKAFYEMRDRLRSGASQPQFLTGNLSHGADLVVAADRTFRSFMRAARSAGLPLPAALRVANQQTQERTGMDMLAELGVSAPADAVPRHDHYGVAEFVALWLAGELPVPVTHCRSTDLYAAYSRWRRDEVAPINVFGGQLLRADAGLSKRIVWVRHGAASERQNARAIILPWLDQYGADRAHRLAEEFDRFAAALAEWKA